KKSVDQRYLPLFSLFLGFCYQKPTSYRPSLVIDIGPRNHSNPWPNRYEFQYTGHVGWYGPKRRREEWRRRRSCC
ncbi:unnamed protein product, partial [Musa textilis]